MELDWNYHKYCRKNINNIIITVRFLTIQLDMNKKIFITVCRQHWRQIKYFFFVWLFKKISNLSHSSSPYNDILCIQSCAYRKLFHGNNIRNRYYLTCLRIFKRLKKSSVEQFSIYLFTYFKTSDLFIL